MPAELYVVATPIGNLGDFSLRGRQVLDSVDFIAAEDTRVSIKLLNHCGIKKPMLTYHRHNIKARGEEIVARILNGQSCAVISDAGMPCISDPGEELVALAAKNGIKITAVPGPSAVVSALAISGLPTSRFCFEGFLNSKKNSRLKRLESIKNDERTMIFYEAPHKLRDTLDDMLRVFGDRRVALCRELTKIHEEVMRFTLSQAARHYAENPPRGEFVIVLEGAGLPEQEKVSFEEAALMVNRLVQGGAPISSAAKDVANRTGHKKSDLYKAALRLFEKIE